MKRVRAACIQQTLVFSQKMEEGVTVQQALALNRAEAESYQARLKRDGIRHQIVSVVEEPEGSVVVRVLKQLNGKADVEEYFS